PEDPARRGRGARLRGAARLRPVRPRLSRPAVPRRPRRGRGCQAAHHVAAREGDAGRGPGADRSRAARSARDPHRGERPGTQAHARGPGAAAGSDREDAARGERGRDAGARDGREPPRARAAIIGHGGPMDMDRRAALRRIAMTAGAAWWASTAGGGRGEPPGSGPIATRPIPASGEALPIIGLGTWQTFDAGSDARALEPLAQVLEAFSAAGGRLIDSSPMYGSSE